MLEVLFEQKPDFNIPTEILNQLPYPCIYFDLNGFDNLEGMLVVKEEHEDGSKGLRIHLLAQIFYAGCLVLSYAILKVYKIRLTNLKH